MAGVSRWAICRSRICCSRVVLALLLMVPCGVEVRPAHAAEQNADAATTSDQDRLKALADEKKLIGLFADTLEQVKSKYVESNVSDRELIEAAIQGMISKLDPYSNYIPPKDLDQFRKGVEREFVGIGIQVSDREGFLQITSPLFGTPAWRGGLRAGDRILQIDDTSTSGLSIDEAIKLMSGDVGTEVSVTILHVDESQPETVQLKRERIQQPTVIGFHRDEKGVWDYFCDVDRQIAYIRITAFSGTTSQELQETLTTLLKQGMRSLVVDLRFNPGGMLNQAIQVSDLFLHEGRIVSIKGRSTPEQTWDAKSEGTLIPKGFPVAVLVNRFSASAAEIVSACLQDNKVATIIGERTWGKGSVQNIIVLEDGNSALKLTTAGYHRPSGQNIHREVGASETDQWGVHPDEGYEVRFSNRDIRDLGMLFIQQDELNKVHHQPAADSEAADSEAADSEAADSEAADSEAADSEAADGEAADGGDAGDETEDSGADKLEFVDRQLDKALETLRAQLDATANEPQHDLAGKNAAETSGDQPVEKEGAPDAAAPTTKGTDENPVQQTVPSDGSKS